MTNAWQTSNRKHRKSRRNASLPESEPELEPWQTARKSRMTMRWPASSAPRSWRPWLTSILARGGQHHLRARYGYLLVWVLVLANAMSVLIQYQSAKLGIVTNKSLPELLGERMSDAAGSCSLCRPRSSPSPPIWRGDRRRHRPEPAVRIAAVHRRFGDRRNLHGDAVVPRWQDTDHVRAHHHRDVADYHIRLHRRPVRGPAEPRRSGQGHDSTLPRHRLGADGRLDSGRHRDAARHLPALHAGERPLRRRRKAVNQNAAERLENRCGLGAVAGRHRESGDAGARRQLAAWHVWHGLHRRRTAGDHAGAWPGDRHDILHRPAGLVVESTSVARMPVPRSCVVFCMSASRCGRAAWSRWCPR